MLRKLYDWVLRLAASKHAPVALAVVSFAESSFFPIPPDVMLAPMVAIRPNRAFVYAGICTAASVAGGLLGYAIGVFLEPLGEAILNLFGLLPYHIPAFIPAYLSIGIWPILMGITQWVQTKLNPAPTDPIQAKMFAFMPVIFTFMFATFPAGLVIYYTWNNLLTVLQQYFIMRREGVEVDLISNIRRKPKKPAE